MRPGKWQRVVAPHFDFLLEHGFEPDPELEQASFWGTSVGYRSAAGAVEVTRSVESDAVDLVLLRLVDGDLPPVEVFFTEAEPTNRAYFEQVLRARSPDREADLLRVRGLGKAEVEEQLTIRAALLRELCADFLGGAPDLFEEVREQSRAFHAEHPQQVVVSLPART